jgi:Cys-rich protein (TIGR01571 family)
MNNPGVTGSINNLGVPSHYPLQFNSNYCDGCKDCKLCATTFFCPWSTFGQNKALLNGEEPTFFSADCLFCFFGFLIAPIAYPCLLTGPRQDIRVLYNFNAPCFEDFCTTLWCPCCSLMQENLDLMEEVENERKN